MPSFGYLSTYPPTRCGLATFTAALATAMVGPGDIRAHIVRVMDDLSESEPAPIGARSVIVGELYDGDPESARDAVRALNSTDAVIVQHEYGIYGGVDGDEVLGVLAAIQAPTIVVLHTVLAEPTPGQRDVLEKVCESATAVVVMTETARRLLDAHYETDRHKVSVIPHGVADWMAVAPVAGSGVHTILTWGLLGPGKGIEWGIRAMAELAEFDPGLHYIVAGQTHPKVLAHEGEQYRQSLQLLIDELGLADRVTLDGRYLQPAQLAALVGSADVVLLPYDTRDQVTSGVLAEAVAAGKQVVATGFPHSLELLRRGAGTIVAHEDPIAIAEAIRRILTRRPHAAIAASRMVDPTTTWPAVAEQYRRLVDEIQVARTA